MAAILDRGLAIPDQVAVVGFGAIDWGAHVRPALTTISVHPATIALRMADLFAGREAPALTVIPRTLLRRGSA
jgi:DNA-binding LacI/PurR family transcriptional regulator